MSRLSSTVLLLFWFGFIWAVLSWQLPAPTQAPPIPRTTLSWNEFFLKHVVSMLPIASSFQSPIRPPQAQGVWVARPFGSEGHLGEDWNTAAGNNDLGEPVYSPADGWVTLAIDFKSVWGKVIMVTYRLPAGTVPPAVEMMFAHLSQVDVKPMQMVKKGERIGLMGNADGTYFAHLHWEVREIIGLGLGGGYDDSVTGWLNPSQFLQSRNPEQKPFLFDKKLPEPVWTAWGSD